MRAAVLQMTSTPDLDANLLSLERLVREAASRGAELVVVPESFAFIGSEEAKIGLAETLPEGGPILAWCRALAIRERVHLLLGGFWESSPDPSRVYNTCVHLAPGGEVAAAYRKIHLFDVDLPDGTRLRESETVLAGDAPVVTTTPFGPLGLSVCYDLRFPELYRRLVELGAEALIVPSAFTLTTGKEHWHVLLRARAIESQAYVLAAAQTGRHFGRRVSYGHALIVDPWGTVISQCSEGEGLALAELDPARVASVRRQLPSLTHRRL
ncbi:MAG: carbon-nitrogen hydrolase family protein [Myxococcales bacterium]|nr:carbon-nitrogen hydrolase family protein [Myxococcales bacterium]